MATPTASGIGTICRAKIRSAANSEDTLSSTAAVIGKPTTRTATQ
jgi:hypothetical protein